MPLGETAYNPSMKSCLGLLFVLIVFTVVLGGGALIWYLSNTAEFSRNGAASATTSATPPKATPVRPQPGKPGQPPVAIPVREPQRR
jgi:hypothetical protein